MKKYIYSRYCFHPDIIKRAVWLYFRFNLSFRDVEEMMTKWDVDVSYETLRQWVDKLGCVCAKRMRTRPERALSVWHLDDVFKKINGNNICIWRAVDVQAQCFMSWFRDGKP